MTTTIIIITAIIIALPTVVLSLGHGVVYSNRKGFYSFTERYRISDHTSWRAYWEATRSKRIRKGWRLYFLLTLSSIWGYPFYLLGRVTGKIWKEI